MALVCEPPPCLWGSETSHLPSKDLHPVNSRIENPCTDHHLACGADGQEREGHDLRCRLQEQAWQLVIGDHALIFALKRSPRAPYANSPVFSPVQSPVSPFRSPRRKLHVAGTTQLDFLSLKCCAGKRVFVAISRSSLKVKWGST